jgi:hypothetical protein
MQALRVLFSPSGRLQPRPFALAAIVVYAAGLASQFLTSPKVLLYSGLWPFAVAQALLIWLWYVVHAKRLRDAGSPIGLAIGASFLYALAVVLLLLVAVGFSAPLQGTPGDANANTALGLILLVWIIAALAGSSSYDLGWLMVAILVVLACLPLLVAIAVTLWAATRPRRKQVAG